MDTIRAGLLGYFRDRHALTEEELSADLPLAEFVTSLGLLELLVFIEKDLGVKLDLVGLSPENFGTPSAVVAYVEQHLQSQRSSLEP